MRSASSCFPVTIQAVRIEKEEAYAKASKLYDAAREKLRDEIGYWRTSGRPDKAKELQKQLDALRIEDFYLET